MEFLPTHLKKYVVEQDYEKYTPIDHAVWRFVMRQLKNYLSQHAHESYLDGLKKTGIEIERIPKISEISQKIEKFGWRAIPVSGFIPPAAFMELQSLGVLPIASDMRSIEHLTYTPAPDIVHEAAGHAPILIHPEFAEYLRKYAQVAKKAIVSHEDLDLYEAIRVLSDLKENPNSTPDSITDAEQNLNNISKNMSHLSEAAELGRMNWWTAEYGLIGPLDSPKIFGAGLLSSVGESKLCLSKTVKKIPLTLDCIKTAYDITEPQPQLFVARDFKHLVDVLEELAETMAFRKGGKYGLDKIIQAGSVNTVQLSTNLQISGNLKKYQTDSQNQPCYLQFQGPTQLAYQDKEISGHSKSYHAEGFGSPVGLLATEQKPISDWDVSDWQKRKVLWDGDYLALPAKLTLEFKSGVKVEGDLVSRNYRDHKTIILSFKNATVEYNGQILFEPSWGIYDMAVGESVASVFGGPADRNAFGEMSDFVAARVPALIKDAVMIERCAYYQKIRELRENQTSGELLLKNLESLEIEISKKFPKDWLLFLELCELSLFYAKQSRSQKSDLMNSMLKNKLIEKLNVISNEQSDLKDLIQEGLKLAVSI